MRYPLFKVAGRPLPFQTRRPLAAAVAPDMGQLLMLNSSGNAVLVSSSVPNHVSFGPADRDQDAGTAAGDASMVAWNTFVSQYQNSTIAGDSFADADMCVPAWGAGVSTFGKLSNYSGANRSLLGLCFGLDGEATPMPLVWVGPVAWCVARAVHMADNDTSSYDYITDSGATNDFGTAADPLILPTAKRHARITSIDIVPSATLAANGVTNYRIVTIYKIDTLTGVVGNVVGTLDLRTQALTKRQPTAFTLSATSADLDMLETDALGYASLHTSSGSIIPQSTIRINRKVQ